MGRLNKIFMKSSGVVINFDHRKRSRDEVRRSAGVQHYAVRSESLQSRGHGLQMSQKQKLQSERGFLKWAQNATTSPPSDI